VPGIFLDVLPIGIPANAAIGQECRMDKPIRKTLAVRVPVNLLNELRRTAARRGATLNDYVCATIADKLDQEQALDDALQAVKLHRCESCGTTLAE
jgi:hypothetical protein